MQLGKLVFEAGREKACFRPSTGEILLPAGIVPSRVTLRHERSHAIYSALPETARQPLYDAFEREIGYDDYMGIIDSSNGNAGHPRQYYTL